MTKMPREAVLEHLRLLADWLNAKHPSKRFELVVGGGAAMALLGFAKATFDVDVFRPATLPQELLDGAAAIGKAKGISADWLNDGLARVLAAAVGRKKLPAYFSEHGLTVVVAPSLTVFVVGRQALISMKLLAASPSERKHVEDLRALGATDAELRVARAFVLSVDNSRPRIEDLELVLKALRVTP